MENLLVGCDPEGFLMRADELISAHGLFQGDKANPYKVNSGAVQVDGMAFEFNIDPANSADMFATSIADVLDQLQAMIPDCKMVLDPVAEFGAEYIAAQPEEAKELGCDPDYNAWGDCVNPKPDGDVSFRTASGHVHIGWTEGEDITDDAHHNMAKAVVKQLDFFLGLPSLLFDADTKRRDMYGKAGAYRCKSYGVEYRVLSNVWVREAYLQKWVYRAVEAAMERLMAGDMLFKKYDIQEIINTSDVEAAKAIIIAEQLEIPNETPLS